MASEDHPQSCDLCGRAFKEGERVIGITTGKMDYANSEGFCADSGEPWLELYHPSCYHQIRDGAKPVPVTSHIRNGRPVRQHRRRK